MNYWMNLPAEYRTGKFVILPIEYEKDLTYGKGASKGSAEIIKASEQLEYYDEQFEAEPFLEGIKQLETVKATEPEEMIRQVSKLVNENKNKFIIGVGGDHSVTLGLTQDLEEDVSVIILDAHPDMFYSWNNSQFNHRCVAQKLVGKHQVLEIGISAMDLDEKKIIENNPQINLIKAYDYNQEILINELNKLSKKIYLSIDVDAFNFINNTGTPEPGGFNWNQAIEILNIIFENKEVIGADVVEFAPENNFRAEAYSLAKLIYKIMSLKSKE
ncbi:MAG: hypothetical protein CMI53_01665 [Parcubacteria group bacterium]|nr:hypothetical protein [Parcubacteria group bacterium]